MAFEVIDFEHDGLPLLKRGKEIRKMPTIKTKSQIRTNGSPVTAQGVRQLPNHGLMSPSYYPRGNSAIGNSDETLAAIYADEIRKAQKEKNYKLLLKSTILAYNLTQPSQKYPVNEIRVQGLNGAAAFEEASGCTELLMAIVAAFNAALVQIDGFLTSKDSHGKMAEDYAARYQKTSDEASKIIQSQKEAYANRIEVRKTEPTDGSKPQRYSAPANLDQLRNALDGTEKRAPDLVRLPIKSEYGDAELMVDRKTLTDAEKNRIVSLKPSDIKTDGVTRYADISEGKIAVLNGEESAIVEAKSIAEDGTRTFDIGGKEVELPPVNIDADIETKHFGKDDYDPAEKWQQDNLPINGLSHSYPEDVRQRYSDRNNKVSILDTERQVMDWAKKILDGADGAKPKIIIGSLPDAISKRILADTGVDLRGYNVSYTKDFIRHFYKRHVKNEANRLPSSIGDILLLPEIIADYDTVRIGDGTLIFEKTFDDRQRAIVRYSVKHSDIVPVTLYTMEKGSGTSRVVHDGEAPSLLGTPLTQSRGSTASDGNSIASTKGVVKSAASTGGKTSSDSQTPDSLDNDVQARYGKGVYKDSASVIVEAANAKDGQTYALSRARRMVDDVDEYVRKFASEDAEVSTSLKKAGVEIGKLRKGELAKRVFTDLNLSKKSDVATRVKEYVANSVFGQKVSYSEKAGESSRYALGDLLTTDERKAIQTQIDKAMDELIANGRTSRYTRMQNALKKNR